MAYSTTTLTGTYTLFDGTPAQGVIEIIPSEKVVKDTNGDVILSGRVKVNLDSSGKFAVELPSTDDPTLNPTGFGYTASAKLHHQHLPAVSFSLPAGSPVDIENVTPVDPSTFTPTATYVESGTLATVATTGAYTDLNGQPAIPADTDVAAWVNDTASQTHAALSGTYDLIRGRDPRRDDPNLDLTGLADAGPAIRAALAFGDVVLPRGTIRVIGDLTLNADGSTLHGLGNESHLAFTDGGLVLDGASAAHVFYNLAENLSITRDGTAGPAVHIMGAGAGSGAARFNLAQIHVESSTGTAWKVDGSYIGNWFGCLGRGSAIGLQITTDAATGTVGGNMLNFFGCEFQGNAQGGQLDTTTGVNFFGGGFEGNTAAGLELLANCRAVGLFGAYFEGNAAYDVKVGTNAPGGVGLVVKGGYYSDGSIGKTASFVLVRGESIAIEDVFFSGYGANSPISVQEASSGAVKGVMRNCKTNGTAALVALNGAARFGESVIGRENSTPIKNVLRASTVLDFPSIAAGGSANLTITVPGAAVGDDCTVHYNGTPPAGLAPLAWVSGSDTVTVRVTNFTAAPVDPPAATMRAIVWKF